MILPKLDILQKLIREVLFKENSKRGSTPTVLLSVTFEVPSICATIQVSRCLTGSKGFIFTVLTPILAIGALEFVGTLFGAEVKQAVAKAMDQIFFNAHTNISLSTKPLYTNFLDLSNLKF